MKTEFSVQKVSGYGQFSIVKETPTGRITAYRYNDAKLYDDYKDGKVSQAKLKRIFAGLDH